MWERKTEGESCISVSEIKEAGRYARSSVPEAYNNCGVVADNIEMYLNDHHGLPYKNMTEEDYGRIHVRVGADKEEVQPSGLKHFVFRIRGYYIKGPYRDENWVWVDASFDQFCDERKENGDWPISYGKKSEIENIRIIRTMEDERMSQYMLPSRMM